MHAQQVEIHAQSVEIHSFSGWPIVGGAGAGGSQKGWLRRLLTGQKTTTDVIKVDPAVNDSLILEAAKSTEGFSGRELAKMVASMQVSLWPGY